ncbi:TPR repeat protein [Alkalispirillum mobile]|uniref:TPR repeat protein n=2 Tax=Alkalispirillum mobile TaxID=85925 RepID=A0A498C4C6_9GAMM|nr:TPR repeat protein [Alkalispirillum mobile]
MIKHWRGLRSVLCALGVAVALSGCAMTTPTDRVTAPSGHSGAVPDAADEAPFWYRLGNHRVHRGDWEAARMAYEQALVADPKHYRARHNLGLVHARLSAQALEKAAAAGDTRAPDPGPLLRALYQPWLEASESPDG